MECVCKSIQRKGPDFHKWKYKRNEELTKCVSIQKKKSSSKTHQNSKTHTQQNCVDLHHQCHPCASTERLVHLKIESQTIVPSNFNNSISICQPPCASIESIQQTQQLAVLDQQPLSQGKLEQEVLQQDVPFSDNNNNNNSNEEDETDILDSFPTTTTTIPSNTVSNTNSLNLNEIPNGASFVDDLLGQCAQTNCHKDFSED